MMKQLPIYTSLIICLALTCGATRAQQTSAEEEAAYRKAIGQRAEKIVNALALTDAEKKAHIQTLVANQYINLRTIHDARDEKEQAIRDKVTDNEKAKSKIAAEEAKANKRLQKLHHQYLAALQKELTPAQVDEVKDGMTYHVAPNTYGVYLDMLPNLTADQKKKILDYLIEAREHAMDAGTSDKKHWWFGQYKGKINNYLSQAGYNMKEAEAAWQKRKQEAKAAADKS